MIALQCCIGFCSTIAQISHNYIYIHTYIQLQGGNMYIYVHIHIPSLLSLPPTHPIKLSHPSSSSQSTRLGSLCYITIILAICFIHGSVYNASALSQLIPPCPSPVVSISPFSTSVPLFLSRKQFHQHRFSRFCIHMLIYSICFSLSVFLHSV